MFAKLLVEMATGKIVANLDDISTLAASGNISISLPVLQVIIPILKMIWENCLIF